jgi:hypothetical protein
MSLKAFHIVFITLSTVLSVFFGVWAIRHYQSGAGSAFELSLGIASLVLAAGLLCYGKYFLRKLKNISYL